MSKRHQFQLNRQNTRKESSNDVHIYLGDPLENGERKKRENEDLHAIVVLEIT